MNTPRTSRISRFYKKSVDERVAIVRDWLGLDADAELALDGGMYIEQANHMIENVVGRFTLPLGIGTNFLINDQDYLIPMVIEEPSVVAAVSNAAKMFREGGGFVTDSDDPVMIGQIQVLDIPDIEAATAAIMTYRQELLEAVNQIGGSIVKRGGGARDIEIRAFPNTDVGAMLVVHLLYDVRDAMGANAINTAVEHLAPRIEELSGGRVNLRILSNLTDRRKARATGIVPAALLARDELTGTDVVKSIVEAGVFAEVDPYRATTHNKGIMNGIDAVILATGNDWRAVESGAHAYAARNGIYTSLTRWSQTEGGDLRGEIELPLSVGIVGGATRSHPTAQLALRILGVDTAQELAEVMAAVGLAQNFAAIRALATEGIQHGHMRMHARQLAISAGATVEQVANVAQRMIADGQIRLEHAKNILQEIENDSNNS